MLLPDGIKPELCVYYLSSFVIAELLEAKAERYDELLLSVNRRHEMSVRLFTLCLDWLYLAGTIKLTPEGEIQLCSSTT